METYINEISKTKMKNPILIEGLPGVGNVGRIAAGYLVTELKMKKVAELYSPHFLPLVLLHPDSTTEMLKNEFYYYKGKKNDLIIVTGETQSITPEGHYDICDEIIQYAKKQGVKSVITLGGYAENEPVKNPRIIGAVSDKALVKKYSGLGIDFGKEHTVGTIVGASGILLGMAKHNKIDGLCIMGETLGMPLVTDPKAADKVLQTLSKIIGIKINLAKLEKIIKEMDEKIASTEKIHKKVFQQIPKKDDQMRYIG